MNQDIPPITPLRKPADAEAAAAHKHVATMAAGVATCAFGTFVLGALLGAAWPAAVVACGLAVMGLGVAWIMMRRS